LTFESKSHTPAFEAQMRQSLDLKCSQQMDQISWGLIAVSGYHNSSKKATDLLHPLYHNLQLSSIAKAQARFVEEPFLESLLASICDLQLIVLGDM
jgi:uncharacterized protein YejL (UPF0352 family)